MERRAEKRKIIETLDAAHITNSDTMKEFVSFGELLNTSLSGFLLTFNRLDLLDDSLKETLNLDSLLGTHISLYISKMDLDLYGVIRKTRHVGKGQFEVFVSFSADTPAYWRECLIDLLPHPGELD